MKTSYKILAAVIILVIVLAILFLFDFMYIPLSPPENLTDLEIT
ncbi:MAG TPA: hypothetical protein VMW74_05530 [Nitrosopumilaceae archaeon]|nr:hypothetical protein [Nitrosopumilaceae archaeon]